jgi:hypothetical protein
MRAARKSGPQLRSRNKSKRTRTMKFKFPTHHLLLILVSVILLIVAAGCASTKQTESLLAAAGFKMIPATTAEQQARLHSLPSGKVSSIMRDGKTYFAFPDVKNNVLYVGTQAQFDQYQKLRLEKQMATEEVEASQMNAEDAFAPWGGWGAIGVVDTEPVYRR